MGATHSVLMCVFWLSDRLLSGNDCVVSDCVSSSTCIMPSDSFERMAGMRSGRGRPIKTYFRWVGVLQKIFLQTWQIFQEAMQDEEDHF